MKRIAEKTHLTDVSREPPQSKQAEQSVLGSLMIDNGTWDAVADKIHAGDFYYRSHQLIFTVIAELASEQKPFDIVTIKDKLSALGELDGVGGIDYLITLDDNTPSAANIAAYADIVVDRAVLRKLISVGTDITNSAFIKDGLSTAERLEHAEQAVFNIAEQQQSHRNGFVDIKTLLKQSIEAIERVYENGDAITGEATGFIDFDRLTSGLQPADLIIVGGRPSMGKTSLMMNIVENIAIKSHKPVVVFSMEMPAVSLTTRMISSIGRVDATKLRSGQLDDADFSKITTATAQIAATKITIDDSAALSIIELRARARRAAREYGQLGLIVVDYLQLMQSGGMGGDNRNQQLSEISRGLKALAKELNVPVIALSQLNRNLEQRPNKRPLMSDLRESGAIEQDADLIVFVYRDEVYNPDSADKGVAEMIVAKHRNGPLGTVRLSFINSFTRFENFSGQQYYQGD
jgi:replicative DNA helicase